MSNKNLPAPAAAAPVAPELEPNAVILMTHPDLPGGTTAEVTYGSFKELWEGKGWKVASSDATSAETQSVPATDTPTE
jgi:hypothetical protein